jgi:opacity protein-like surface antigen
MAKKAIVMTVLAMLVAGSIFAQEEAAAPVKKPGIISIGAGGLFVPSFYTTEMPAKTDRSTGFGGGLNIFLDVKYAEVNLDLLFTNEKQGASDGYDTINLTLGLLLKYPIPLGQKFILFPSVGYDYRFALAASQDGDKASSSEAADMFNAFSLLWGLGFDYNITQKLYIRLEAAFGLTFDTEKITDMKEDAGDDLKVFTGKLPIKLAVAYRF